MLLISKLINHCYKYFDCEFDLSMNEYFKIATNTKGVKLFYDFID